MSTTNITEETARKMNEALTGKVKKNNKKKYLKIAGIIVGIVFLLGVAFKIFNPTYVAELTYTVEEEVEESWTDEWTLDTAETTYELEEIIEPAWTETIEGDKFKTGRNGFYTVGEEIEPAVYDVNAIDGKGNVFLKCKTNPKLPLNLIMGPVQNDHYDKNAVNVDFRKGCELETKGVAIELQGKEEKVEHPEKLIQEGGEWKERIEYNSDSDEYTYFKDDKEVNKEELNKYDELIQNLTEETFSEFHPRKILIQGGTWTERIEYDSLNDEYAYFIDEIEVTKDEIVNYDELMQDLASQQ